MSPLLAAAFGVVLLVIVCWSGAQAWRWVEKRARRRGEDRRGGLIEPVDFSRRRL